MLIKVRRPNMKLTRGQAEMIKELKIRGSRFRV